MGQPAAAAARSMVCIVAGDAESVAYVKPILDSLGRATIVVGEDATQGKLVSRVERVYTQS
jgi:3-hydroxyisobutyrate dehydrogenase-like beta-hydroxyacid dehydrogenase